MAVVNDKAANRWIGVLAAIMATAGVVSTYIWKVNTREGLHLAAMTDDAGGVIEEINAGSEPDTNASWPRRDSVWNQYLGLSIGPKYYPVEATPLHVAALYSSHRAINALLDSGANPNAILKGDGRTPLHFAVSQGDFQSVDTLLSHGADPNLYGDGADAVIFYALNDGRLRILRKLIDHGAMIDIQRQGNGMSPMEMARSERQATIVAYLESLIEIRRNEKDMSLNPNK